MIFTLVLINSIAFIVYGTLCITTSHMIEEFTRYGLLRFRLLTGYLELLGGLGCLVGHFTNSFIQLAATAGLAILMVLGVYTRIRVSDPWHQILPAFFLCLLNIFIFYKIYPASSAT